MYDCLHVFLLFFMTFECIVYDFRMFLYDSCMICVCFVHVRE